MEGSGSFVVEVYADAESLARAAAELFIECSAEAVTRSGRFTVALSGGETPLATFRLLAEPPFRNRVDWSLVHVFWGDERCVPPEDPRSNYGVAFRLFLSRVPIPLNQIHPILCADGPARASREYESILKSTFDTSSRYFDLILLGLGLDGHTASLFPDSAALDEKEKWVTYVQNPIEKFPRVTMTLPRLNLTRKAIFLVAGAAKKNVFQAALSAREPCYSLPVRLIHPLYGDVIWLVEFATTR